jgi:hypothetical protein
MLHGSSGRNNFRVVRPTNNPVPSQQQKPNDQTTNLIEQQTREAIKAATETNTTNNDNSNNSKETS